MRKNNKNSINKFVAASVDLMDKLNAKNYTSEHGSMYEFVLKTDGGELFVKIPKEDTDEHDLVYTIYARFKEPSVAWGKFGAYLYNDVNKYSGKYNLMVVGSIKKVIDDMKFHFGMVANFDNVKL